MVYTLPLPTLRIMAGYTQSGSGAACKNLLGQGSRERVQKEEWKICVPPSVT